ncbi:uncharacterized protein SPPG_08700 [Spizellomyces punctatus DAOM BR117]|uniref:Uncharacterized protein n=1 Tax=Spizellomyces punctatus (strain DAOM BR117) TaxID=645134 RepID=A0A0L0H4P9_SPIPD|nr:uncharacterized protein SPPG_08700 [Spizellomyces punctatus DAOM BR117]KNC95949.1 hypothetical protein SPPG_08700 [Spizellomyces punctatus DAOM BR117]|eukprot:XP_016603989.1 hypothetical protein SPPG_08700 [Spizellomyces punctatus DAOM BR117]
MNHDDNSSDSLDFFLEDDDIRLIEKIGINPCDTSIRTRSPLFGSINFDYDGNPSHTSTSRGTASSCRMEQVLSALEEQASAIQSLRKTLEGIKGPSSEVNWETFGGLGGIARRVQRLEGTIERLASSSGTPIEASLSSSNESELCPERRRGRSTSIEIIPATQVHMGDKVVTAEIPTTYIGGIPNADDLRTLIARTVEENVRPMIDDAIADLRREWNVRTVKESVRPMIDEAKDDLRHEWNVWTLQESLKPMIDDAKADLRREWNVRTVEQSIRPMIDEAKDDLRHEWNVWTLQESIKPMIDDAKADLRREWNVRAVEEDIKTMIDDAKADLRRQWNARTIQESIKPMIDHAKADLRREWNVRTVEQTIKPMIDEAKADLRRELIHSMPSLGGPIPQDSSIFGGKISAGATDEGAKRPAVIPTCGTGLVGDVGDVRRKLDKKVDTVVLEELMRHIPTRDEVKRLVQELVDARPATIGEQDIFPILLRLQRESTASGKDGSGQNQASKSSAQREDSDASREWKHLLDELLPDIRVCVSEMIADKEVTITHNLEMKIIKLQRELLEFIPIDRKNRKGEVQHLRKEVENKVRKDLKAWLEKRITHIREETVERIKKVTADVREDINNVTSARDSPDSAYYEPPYENVSNEDEGITPHSALDRLSRRLTREFDEKLFLLCSDLSTCKSLYAKQISQPFHRCAQWLWKSGCLKFGSAIPWNYETLNTDRDNFLWEKDQTSIRIGEPGLYEITFAFFTKAKPSVQLVVNGESVLSAINSPSYVVHHSSGFVVDGDGRIEPGTVTGISLLDFLALPPKSTLSVHYHGGKKGMLGHGFLGLRKL